MFIIYILLYLTSLDFTFLLCLFYSLFTFNDLELSITLLWSSVCVCAVRPLTDL